MYFIIGIFHTFLHPVKKMLRKISLGFAVRKVCKRVQNNFFYLVFPAYPFQVFYQFCFNIFISFNIFLFNLYKGCLNIFEMRRQVIFKCIVDRFYSWCVNKFLTSDRSVLINSLKPLIFDVEGIFSFIFQNPPDAIRSNDAPANNINAKFTGYAEEFNIFLARKDEDKTTIPTMICLVEKNTFLLSSFTVFPRYRYN